MIDKTTIVGLDKEYNELISILAKYLKSIPKEIEPEEAKGKKNE